MKMDLMEEHCLRAINKMCYDPKNFKIEGDRYYPIKGT